MSPTVSNVRDVLGGRLGDRTHFIHCVLALHSEPMDSAEIGRQAATLARLCGRIPRPNTFSRKVTDNHLRVMTGNGLADCAGPGLWELTRHARDQITTSGRG